MEQHIYYTYTHDSPNSMLTFYFLGIEPICAVNSQYHISWFTQASVDLIRSVCLIPVSLSHQTCCFGRLLGLISHPLDLNVWITLSSQYCIMFFLLDTKRCIHFNVIYCVLFWYLKAGCRIWLLAHSHTLARVSCTLTSTRTHSSKYLNGLCVILLFVFLSK